MNNVLYLLPECSVQVDYSTKAKYLYDTKVNNSIVNYLDCLGVDYLYLSLDKGIIHNEDVIEPYEIKKFEDKKSFTIWSLCCYNMISEYMKSHKLKEICILCNLDTYSILESLLEKDYKISSPIKCFSKESMILRWLDKQIIDNIEKRYN